jgi:glycosyltransferase involved in cell wall biosynthesis
LHIIYVTGESFIDHSYTIVNELKKHISLKVYFYAKDKNDEVTQWLNKFDAEFIKRKRFRNVFSIFGEFVFILKLRKQKADCIWFNTMTIYHVYFAKYLLKNYLVMVHDVELHPESKDRYSKLAVSMSLKHQLRKIAVASKTQSHEFHKRFGFFPKVFQLPVIDYYKETGYPADNTQSPGKIRFLFFGTIENYKGLETLLDAAELLEQKGKNFEVNVFGKLKYDKDKFLERIKKLKTVNLTDKFIHYKEIHKIYNNNDIIVLPYKQVTQCGPLLIGFSENIPAIVSNHAGFIEYVDDGKSALVFTNSTESLAEKMETIIDKPELIGLMKEFIKSETMKKFSMESLVKDYIENFI